MAREGRKRLTDPKQILVPFVDDHYMAGGLSIIIAADVVEELANRTKIKMATATVSSL